MNQLHTGQFYGQTNQIIHLNGLTLTDTEYTHEFVDWHFHENAYFTFILDGKLKEGNKKEIYECLPGNLLFHNWQEPHYNIKPKGYARGFQIELNNLWFDKYDFNIKNLQGSIKITNIDIKLLLYKIFKESKIGDNTSILSIQTLILKAVEEMFRNSDIETDTKPRWVSRIKEILFYEFSDRLTLEYLSDTLGIHPVHLSRDFSKYFHCNLGEYIRKLKIQKSYTLLSNKQLTLTEIAYNCGFSDQSHFSRCFKSEAGISPKSYRKLIAD
ncbi:MAG: helix-turn-helix transcriptional regulator [Bacteroidetes bacterium]|nr:helix-turn-helix transcriptional regulator [Bacteroidota bacterium]MBL0073240.1 helix-turn-helix transcriptional regulator [Bacteroidota bacterium]